MTDQKTDFDGRRFNGQYFKPVPPPEYPIMPAPSAGIFDAPSVYICVNSEWVSYLVVRLAELAREDAWIGDETEQRRASQQIKELFSAMACEDCNDFLTDIGVDPATGKLRVRKGGAWADANGEGAGGNTVINNQSTLVQNLYPPADTNAGISAAERACNIASGLSEWMFDKFNDELDTIDAATDAIAAADAIILLIFPPMYPIVDGVNDFIAEVVEAGTEYLRSAFDTTQKEELLCAIYCALEEDGEVNASNIAALNGAMITSMNDPILLAAFTLFIVQLDNNAIIHRAMLYQSSESAVNCALLCIDCAGGGCSTYELGGEGWEITIGNHLASGCSGHHGNDNGGSGEHEIWFTLPTAKNINLCYMDSSNPLGTVHSLVEIYNDTTLVTTVLDFSGTGEAPCNNNNFPTSGVGNRVRFYNTCTVFSEYSNIKVCWDG